MTSGLLTQKDPQANGDSPRWSSSIISRDDNVSELRQRFGEVPAHVSRSYSVDEGSVHYGLRSPALSVTGSTNGNLLSVSPAHLSIVPGESSQQLVLKNVHSTGVVFKVNTTLPNEFRIRPSSGLLTPQEAAEVGVSWKEGGPNLWRGRFQILALAVPAGTPKAAALSQLRSAPRETLWEARLGCCGPEGERPVPNEPASLQSLSEQLAGIQSEQERQRAELAASHSMLLQLRAVTGLVVLLVLLTLIIQLRTS